MAYKPLTIGISTSALFDLREEHTTYVDGGIDAYRRLQFERRRDPMKPGTAFHVIEKLLSINTPGERPRVEVALISRNNIETGIRARYSLDYHKLDIARIALTGGKNVESSLLRAYGIDLFLSRHADDVQRAVDGDIAASVLHDPPTAPQAKPGKVHFAFDGDQVLFGGESETIFQREGLLGFLKYETEMAETPMPEGPFAKVLFVIEALKATFPKEDCPIETSLVTMRSGQAQIRPMNTLIEWGQIVDGAYMIGRSNQQGPKYEKVDVLAAIGADLFFDDQTYHTEPASRVVPSGYVPQKSCHKAA
ncbi:MAG TPA: 5'-nucleotidase [Alphaproteobacteria bacterium]|nr:5'-nucleotidase [Alphaproteobacteria bacterium]HRJ67562.1 5'-nucleotidase [Alphaproteobacteria bacterium]